MSKQIKKDENYMIVAEALAYIFERKKAEEKRENAKRKARRMISIFTIIGSIILISLAQITTYSYDFSWMADAKKWYSDLFVSFMSYIFITDMIFILEKHCKLDQRPFFGYTWPFIGFFISLLLTNSVKAEFVLGEPRMKIAIFLIFLIPAISIMRSSYKTGEMIANRENETLNTIKKIVEDNPSTVEKVIEDFENDVNSKNK